MAVSDDRLSSNFDLNLRPWIAIWEVTRACDLACRHCRADAQPWRHPGELTTAEGAGLLQQRVQRHKNGLPTLDLQKTPRGINDGSGFVFISHTGDVFPSGFLPLSAGNIRTQSLDELYRDSPMFQALRDRSQLKGKCGVCEFRHVCGGSRARAYALAGDWLASDPACSYIPPAALQPEWKG